MFVIEYIDGSTGYEVNVETHTLLSYHVRDGERVMEVPLPYSSEEGFWSAVRTIFSWDGFRGKDASNA